MKRNKDHLINAKRDLLRAAKAIRWGLKWDEEPEGIEYWLEQHIRLKELAREIDDKLYEENQTP